MVLHEYVKGVSEFATAGITSSEEEHLQQLRRLSPGTYGEVLSEQYYDFHQKLDNQFPWQITAGQLLALKYHASVASENMFSPIVSTEKDIEIMYSGDFPEFALEKIFAFKDIVNVSCNHISNWDGQWGITIHSNEPLPVQMVSLRRRLDPVVVGWITCPGFCYYHKRLWGRPEHWAARNNKIGRVIAIWDNDKELEL